MFTFILQILLMSSLGVMIYLMARAVPRVGNIVRDNSTSRLHQWFNAVPWEKLDVIFGGFLEKILRKIKLVVLKLDNIVSYYLHRVKKFTPNGNGQNGASKPTLFDEKNNSAEN